MEKGHRGKGAGQKDRGLKKNNLIKKRKKEGNKKKTAEGKKGQVKQYSTEYRVNTIVRGACMYC